MKEKSVTILVTLKNSAATIKQCIDSLLKQTYRNYEILVVDAFSTDGSYEILKSFGKRIKLKQFRSNAPQGFNYGIKLANSEYLAFTDSDCIVDKNWLKELMSGFTSDDILAVAGYCGTPRNASKLQKIIGVELENRYKQFPKFITRSPTMNFCVRTKMTKKLMFDEKLEVAFETDFGYRLTKLGKMYYNKKAVIYHFHRATWKNFFKQQMKYGEYSVPMYIKNRSKISGDMISKTHMLIQPFILYMSILLFAFNLPLLSLLMIVILLMMYAANMLEISRDLNDISWFFAIFLLRTIAWSLGGVEGLFKLIFR
jgi:glycosyltransferase involved in cell wall biosynthesis